MTLKFVYSLVSMSSVTLMISKYIINIIIATPTERYKCPIVIRNAIKARMQVADSTLTLSVYNFSLLASAANLLFSS